MPHHLNQVPLRCLPFFWAAFFVVILALGCDGVSPWKEQPPVKRTVLMRRADNSQGRASSLLEAESTDGVFGRRQANELRKENWRRIIGKTKGRGKGLRSRGSFLQRRLQRLRSGGKAKGKGRLTPLSFMQESSASRHKQALKPSELELRFTDRIQQQLDKMFNHQSGVNSLSNVSVLAASPGSWSPSDGCTTPKLWVYLYGVYRSFDYTKHSLVEMASKSSHDCYFISAVMPDDVGKYGDKATWPAGNADVASALKAAQGENFGGRMAYAVIKRFGLYNRVSDDKSKYKPPGYKKDLWEANSTEDLVSSASIVVDGSLQGALDLFWYSIHLSAKMAASLLGFTPSPSSVVMRSRPDVQWQRYYNLVNTTRYFEAGRRGRHLAFGTDIHVGGQGDYSFLTSFASYASDVADAYEFDPSSNTGPYPTTARTNGWGYGFSFCGWKNACSDQSSSVIEDLDGSCRGRKSGEPVPECCAGRRACPMTVVQKVISQGVDIIRDPFKSSQTSVLQGPDDPTSAIRIYCPNSVGDGYEPQRVPYVMSGPWYVSSNFFNLVSSNGSIFEPWPDGC